MTATPQLGRYEIDTDSSTIAFTTRHFFGLLAAHGEFAIRTGTIDIAEPLTDSSLSVEIETASLRTGNTRRDRAVRSARFLDADRYPLIAFASEQVDRRAVHGTLTVCGVARPASLLIEESAVAAGMFTIHASTSVDRTEFGVTASPRLVGRRLDISLHLTCVHL
ncbi:YceI family protein [Streptomyces sp. NPDC020965]|uniref:YceI family protein n=1 Tax=Streptomyces sp. NPDC020965 TaxID=3365105 RepID=UPI0037A740B2